VDRVLGEVVVGGEPVTRRRERELFGLLVAARGRPVPVDRVVEELWAEDTPRSAVQVVVSRLRALLVPDARGPRGVVGTAAGYRLDRDRASVDAWVFERLVERALAAVTPTDRLVVGTQAVDLWAGEPYADCEAPSLRAEAARLVDLHVAVQEVRAGALLGLGHPDTAVRLLVPVAADHPYRESLWALLARAQYAGARQADALTTLATLRSRLVTDLGVDPSPVVRAIEQAILRQDPGLTPVHAPVATPRRAAHGSSLCRHRRRSSAVRPATAATASTAPSTHSPFSEAIQAWSTAIPIVT
jgi:DNA-binding SARP family transcriptional activator